MELLILVQRIIKYSRRSCYRWPSKIVNSKLPLHLLPQILFSCFGKFKYAHDLTNTPEQLAIATRRVIEEFADENAIYLELRSTPRKNEFMSKLEYVSTICETIYECSEKRPEIMVKYLPSIDRAQSVAENQETLDIIIQLLEDYSSVIVGLDLNGNPSLGNFNDLKPILSQARREGLRLAVHCSEIAGRVEETREVLEFGVDRIGHGTFLDGS